MTVVDLPRARAAVERRYSVHGSGVRVRSGSAAVVDALDGSFAPLAVDGGRGTAGAGAASSPSAMRDVSIDRAGPNGERLVVRYDGRTSLARDESEASLFAADGVVNALCAGLVERGLEPVHAGSVSLGGRGLALAGRSGSGKTTLTLGLVGRGWAILSDELAILEHATRAVRHYPRAVHLRAGTIELLPRLSPVTRRGPHPLGGGNEWAASHAEVAALLGGATTDRARFAGVLLLEPVRPGARPEIHEIPAAVAAVELLGSTWAAGRDFGGALARVATTLTGVPCARLRPGDLGRTLTLVQAWHEANR